MLNLRIFQMPLHSPDVEKSPASGTQRTSALRSVLGEFHRNVLVGMPNEFNKVSEVDHS
jgi:hypothetical protein